ncbi:DUF2500 domain-containing protein [Paenibacillus sp. EKM208P]|nr:DUF2500 domain-containing protein [Paenibacillus sp. EKM208P]
MGSDFMEFQSFNMIFFIVFGLIAITFEFDGGERMELEVKDTVFGMIVIGDRGELQYKGTRFLEFVRVMEA